MSLGITEDEMQATRALDAHMRGGVTTVAHCWILRRADGVVLGFTDHDRDLRLFDVICRASSGLNGLALSQSTGLGVDHAEAIGALSDALISEEDIQSGRYDGAEIEEYLVNWSDTAAWKRRFRGTIGEITRAGSAFRAELRGLSDQLNHVTGRVYTKSCSAVLGDARCGFDFSLPGFTVEIPAGTILDGRDFTFASQELDQFREGWFARGTIEVLSGPAANTIRTIKYDRQRGRSRQIGLWEPIDAPLTPTDQIRLVAGCDKRMATCQEKFNNLINFQGFPDIPGASWGEIIPARASFRDGGSRR